MQIGWPRARNKGTPQTRLYCFLPPKRERRYAASAFRLIGRVVASPRMKKSSSVPASTNTGVSVGEICTRQIVFSRITGKEIWMDLPPVSTVPGRYFLKMVSMSILQYLSGFRSLSWSLRYSSSIPATRMVLSTRSSLIPIRRSPPEVFRNPAMDRAMMYFEALFLYRLISGELPRAISSLVRSALQRLASLNSTFSCSAPSIILRTMSASSAKGRTDAFRFSKGICRNAHTQDEDGLPDHELDGMEIRGEGISALQSVGTDEREFAVV